MYDMIRPDDDVGARQITGLHVPIIAWTNQACVTPGDQPPWATLAIYATDPSETLTHKQAP